MNHEQIVIDLDLSVVSLRISSIDGSFSMVQTTEERDDFSLFEDAWRNECVFLLPDGNSKTREIIQEVLTVDMISSRSIVAKEKMAFEVEH